MKRRDFVAKGVAGVLGTGLVGCSAAQTANQSGRAPAPTVAGIPTPNKSGKYTLWRELSHFAPRPAGTMPTRELGKTGIQVSQLTFGSHIRREMVGLDYQREHVIREAFDLGITTFDVYDTEGRAYQYEPMGKMLEPINKDVVISLSFRPAEGRNPEQEFERILRLFKRDHIDLMRSNAADTNVGMQNHELLAKWKEQGKIRAIGAAIHDIPQVEELLDQYPLDYVIFPYNFYHNVFNPRDQFEDMDPIVPMLRKRGIGVVTMKAFGGDYCVAPFVQIARKFVTEPDVKFPQAAIRYVLNSGIDADTTFIGMYSTNHVYDDVKAFYEMEMSAEEKELLNNLEGVAIQQSRAWLPDHYKWLDNLAPKPSNREILDSV